MIKVTDQFLPPNAFSDLQNYCSENEFQIVAMGEKSFSVLETPRYLFEFLQIKGYELILTFIRSAHKDFDNDLRIHADNRINGRMTALAAVIYINEIDEIEPHGTCFYDHHKYGQSLPVNTTAEEFDRLLTEDSNDITKWKRTDMIFARPNRRLLYSSNNFHSKHPAKIEVGVRKILVCFYSKRNPL